MYVVNNPLRSGLVERWGDYRCSGSSVFGLADAGGGQARDKPPHYAENWVNAYAPAGGEGQGEGAPTTWSMRS